MPFEPLKDQGSAQQSGGGFKPLGDAESVYIEADDSVINAPANSSPKEVLYMNDTQNKAKPPSNYFGLSNIGNPIDYAKGYMRGIVNTGVSFSKLSLEGDEKRLNKLNNWVSGSKEFGIVDWLLEGGAPMFEDSAARDDRWSAEALQLKTRINEKRASYKDMPAVLDGMGLGGKQTLAGDLGQGTVSIVQQAGAIAVSKNPAFIATALFGLQQKGQDYSEARDAGLSVDEASDVSNKTALATSIIELVGTNALMKSFGESTVIKRAVKSFIAQGTEEGAQELSSILIKNNYDVTKTNFEDGLGQVMYASLIGGILGAPVGAMMRPDIQTLADEFGVTTDDLEAIIQYSERMGANNPNIQELSQKEIQSIIDSELSSVENSHADQRIVQNVIDDFVETGQVNLDLLDRKDRIVVEGVISSVDKKLTELDAIENKGLLPVPKRPETLSKFLKRLGGLKDDTGEARQFTRKENPSLNGVTNKNGVLTLDEALKAAISGGFISEGFDPNNPTDLEINDLLEALHQEARGVDVVSDVNEGEIIERNHILDFNEEQSAVNTEIADGAKGLSTIRQAFRTAITAARKDVKSVQNAIIKALDDAKLRPEDKAKFIKKIKNTQTVKQLKKEAPKIEEKIIDLLEVDLKRSLRKKIKKAISRAKKANNLAVDVVEQIRALDDRLRGTGVLGSGMKDTPISDFQEAFIEAKILLADAKVKLSVMNAMKEARFTQRLEDLANGTTALSNTDLKDHDLGGKLSVVDKLKNIYIEGMNRAQRLNINKNSMDVIMDIMDGYSDYTGANSTIFKRKMDISYNNYLQLREKTSRDVKNLSDELNLTAQNYDRIGAFAALQQEGGDQKLLNSGVTKEEINALKLSDAEMQMYELMRDKLDALRPAIKEVMRVVYNKDLSNVKNYFPFMTDFKAMKDFEIQEMFGDDVLEISAPDNGSTKKGVQKGFTKERTGGKQKIRIDAMGVFLNHVDNASYLINLGQDVSELGRLANSEEYREIAGDLGQQIMSDWISLIAKKGRVGNEVSSLDALRVNTGAAVLGFKLSSALIQPTALLDGAGFIGGSYVTRGINNITNKDWRQFIFSNMPEIRERVGDDPNYIDMGGTGLLAKQRQAGFWALQRLDLLAASAVASGAYVKSVEERGGVVDFNNPDPLAIQEAQLAVRRSQSSGFAKDAAPIISQGKLTGNVSVDKIILQFQSFMFNRWSMIQHDLFNAGLRQGKTIQAANIAAWLMLANMSEMTIRHYTKELVAAITGGDIPDDDDMSEKAAKQLISNVPFVSSFISSAEYGSVPVPSISMFESVAESLSYAQKSKSPEKKQKHYTNAALQGLGTAFGISGTLQAKQFIKPFLSGGDSDNNEGGRSRGRKRGSASRRGGRGD